MENIMIGYGYKSPCKGCEKRTVGCHSTCEAYTKSRKEYDERATAARKERALLNDTLSYIIQTQGKIIKERGCDWRGKE